MKYKLFLKLEREGSELVIEDTVKHPFSLNDYIFDHDLELYSIIEYSLTKIKEE